MLIEVVHALPGRVIAKTYRLPEGACIEDALQLAATDADFAGVDFSHGHGIHGRRVPARQRLIEGDRVEIYRPLREDPKSARRRRAAGGLNRSGRS